MKTVEELISLLAKKFPKAWFKSGDEFSRNYGMAIWTGEGSYINEEPMFNYNSSSPKYKFGAHVDLCNFVEKHGYYVECYDCGTFFIFPI